MFELKNYHYTEKEAKQLLESLVFLVDTREQDNSHIVSAFTKKNRSYKEKALKSGDYSVMLPKNLELGIVRDIYFDKYVVVERKNSLEELSGNIAQHRMRFENELFRTTAKVHLLVEAGSWIAILKHCYSTNLNEKAYYRSLLCLQAKYDMCIHFISKELAGFHIMNLLECAVKELLCL